jgi:FkbM family methyltransferase
MIRRALNRLRRGRPQPHQLPTFLSERLLAALAAETPDATFIEIGANDGEQHDHIKEFIRATEWSGVMVEPVDYVYERLLANHGSNPRIALERAVISDSDGTVPFYFLAPPRRDELDGLPDWYDGIGSLSREAVLSHRRHIPDIDERLRSEDLPSMTLDTLCAKHAVERFDLLVLDTEGYDAQLLSRADLDRYGPRVIIYEHFHLGRGERLACHEMLAGHGYDTKEEGFDTLAFKAFGSEALQHVWDTVEVAVAGVYAESEERE